MAYSHQAPRTMTLRRTRHAGVGAMAMPRRRGVSSGTLLVLLGIWGGIIPFVGPIFGYRMDTAASWAFTWDRLWLSILPGAAAFLGGLILLGAANRLSAGVGSWLALAGGVWFVVGPTFSLLWSSPIGSNGVGLGSGNQRFLEQIGFSYGLGAVVTALAAGALARVAVRTERDAALLESAVVADPVTASEAYPDDAVTATEPYPGTAGAAGPSGPTGPAGTAASGPASGEEYRTEAPAAPGAERDVPRAGADERPGRLSWPEDEDESAGAGH